MDPMDETIIISTDEVMTTNYRGLQQLAKRVGVRANTRQDVLRASLLRVSFETQSRSPEELFEESEQRAGVKMYSVCLVIFALLCLSRFPNSFAIVCWGIVALLAYFGITASVLAGIFCCK